MTTPGARYCPLLTLRLRCESRWLSFELSPAPHADKLFEVSTEVDWSKWSRIFPDCLKDRDALIRARPHLEREWASHPKGLGFTEAVAQLDGSKDFRVVELALDVARHTKGLPKPQRWQLDGLVRALCVGAARCEDEAVIRRALAAIRGERLDRGYRSGPVEHLVATFEGRLAGRACACGSPRSGSLKGNPDIGVLDKRFEADAALQQTTITYRCQCSVCGAAWQLVEISWPDRKSWAWQRGPA